MIRFERLTKHYGPVTAVRDLTLEAVPGEVYALLGPNGAGKTTALRCLGTLIQPSEGTAFVDNVDVRTNPIEARRKIAFLAASMGLYERLSAKELVAYFGRLHGLDEAAVSTRVDEMVELFGITEFADRLCGRLSTGQRQRVSLARALVHDPPLILADEPTGNLNSTQGEEIMDLFIRLNREESITMFIITHDMKIANQCTSYVKMKDGVIHDPKAKHH